MVKILLIIAGGMVASLYVTAQAAVTIRSGECIVMDFFC